MSDSISFAAPLECHVTVMDDASAALDQLTAESGLSKSQIKQAMLKGALWRRRDKLTQRIRRADKFKTGDTLYLYFDEKVLSETPAEPQLMADEGAYSVWYKPYGMRSQGSKWGDHCALYRWVEVNFKPQRPAFLVHRLDRAATGMIIVAHEKKAAAALADLFEKRQIDKWYQTIVAGQFSSVCGTWAKQRTFNAEIDGKAACSHARCLAYDAEKNRSLLEVSIETGRKHQIRRHLAGDGFPVIGDRLYGDGAETGLDLQLTACSLAFKCPITGTDKDYQLPAELLPSL